MAAAPKVVRPVEACHVLGGLLVLVAFFAWVPFCFDVPSGEEAHFRCAQPSAALPAADHLAWEPVVVASALDNQASALSGATAAETGGRAQEGQAQPGQQEQDAARGMRLLTYVVALVAGGLMNLEVFQSVALL